MFAEVALKRQVVEMRKIEKGILTHCYQRTVDGGVLFYSITDHLVYFTSYCVHARKYGIKVLGICQMPDHVHDSLVVGDMDNLAAFKRDQNAWFTKNQNDLQHSRATFQASFWKRHEIRNQKSQDQLDLCWKQSG